MVLGNAPKRTLVFVATSWVEACVSTHLHALECFLVARSEKAEAAVLPHLTLAVVVGDAHGDAHAAGAGAGAPGRGLHQAVLLPG